MTLNLQTLQTQFEGYLILEFRYHYMTIKGLRRNHQTCITVNTWKQNKSTFKAKYKKARAHANTHFYEIVFTKEPHFWIGK